jgi:hypothetical protein
MTRLILALGLALLLAPSAEATRFYKWVDENGVTHYSDSPPEHGRYEQIQTRDPVSRLEDLPLDEDDAEDEGAQPAPAPPAGPQTLSEARRINCETARTNLATLTSFEVIRMDLDGDGQLDTLSAEQRQDQIERAREQIELFCDEE